MHAAGYVSASDPQLHPWRPEILEILIWRPEIFIWRPEHFMCDLARSELASSRLISPHLASSGASSLSTSRRVLGGGGGEDGGEERVRGVAVLVELREGGTTWVRVRVWVWVRASSCSSERAARPG